jgi:hypothetical protein
MPNAACVGLEVDALALETVAAGDDRDARALEVQGIVAGRVDLGAFERRPRAADAALIVGNEVAALEPGLLLELVLPHRGEAALGVGDGAGAAADEEDRIGLRRALGRLEDQDRQLQQPAAGTPAVLGHVEVVADHAAPALGREPARPRLEARTRLGAVEPVGQRLAALAGEPARDAGGPAALLADDVGADAGGGDDERQRDERARPQVRSPSRLG